MKLKFNHLSHRLLLSSYLLGASITAYAHDHETHKDKSEIEIAMYTPLHGTDYHPIKTGLSAEKMLMMAQSLSTERMSAAQQNLAFALTYSAARKGSAEAQFRLANYYLGSDIVTEDDNEAAYWLEEAIAQGHIEAKFIYEHLGVADFDVGC